LPEQKQESTVLPVKAPELPERLILPLQQHIGEPAEPLVGPGDKVLKGQMIARAVDAVSAPIHASSSGTVLEISNLPVPHPSGLSAPCIVIQTDGRDKWLDRATPLRNDYLNLSPSQLRQRILEAGIVGMGGAGFPSFIKLNPGPDKIVDTLLLNGAECEPYVSCDDMLMREHPQEIVTGALIMLHAVQAKNCIIALEDNKPQAFTSLEQTVEELQLHNIKIVQVPTIYPAGGEKQLIKVVTGQELPAKSIPISYGIVCHNVATAAATYRAVYNGEPLISRYVTVTGSVTQPRNLDVLIGTPVRHLIEACGGQSSSLENVIMGGPMMGFALPSMDVPIIKTSICILSRSVNDKQFPTRNHSMPCIRCGSCAEACPVKLLPQQLYWYARAKDFDKAKDYNLFDCIECGCCDYVCPSHIPLVQYYRFAKTHIRSQEREKHKADVARRRHEFHLQRIAREKVERAERHKRKAAAVAKVTDKDEGIDEKKAAILAAVKRARAKKEQRAFQPNNVKDLAEQQNQLVEQDDTHHSVQQKGIGQKNNQVPDDDISQQARTQKGTD
jgi:electron transport complex protein RnfC